LDKEPTDIQQLIKKAVARDQKAFHTLLNTYWSDVFRYQLSKTQNENEAEDISIKTFAKAFDNIDRYDQQYPFKNWLITISKNIFLDHLRKKRSDIITTDKINNESYDIFDESPSAEDQLIKEQHLAQLLDYIKMLKPHYQEMINLRYFREMTYKEMSETLNEPMSNIKVKLLRAKRLLAQIIDTSTDIKHDN